jgi:hypothetical protein
VQYIERSKNTEADELAKAATCNMPLPVDVFFEAIKEDTVKMVEPEPMLINTRGKRLASTHNSIPSSLF